MFRDAVKRFGTRVELTAVDLWEATLFEQHEEPLPPIEQNR